MPMLTIIGCGSPNRSDDGVGVVVARRLQTLLTAHPRPDVQVMDAGTGGMDVMFQARGSRSLILIDACRSGSEPGAVFRVPGAELETAPEPAHNLHDFRWQHALYAGRRIYGEAFPKDVEVYLVEAQRLDLGTELSPAVARAADIVVERIRARMETPGGHGGP